MTRIAPLRNQLNLLREKRRWIRWGTGYAGVVLAVAWSLASLFALDVIFDLSLPQRLLLMAGGAVAFVWAWRKFTRPFLGVHEDVEDMALLVEREHQIDNDLIAAMQFESGDATRWGSTQLQTAVVDYVVELGSDLDVFQGLSREQLVRRGGLLAVTVAAAVMVAASFPGHVGAFFNRLLMGSQHYPTATRIRQVLINRSAVLLDSQDGTQPRIYKGSQGQGLRFELLADGTLPDSGAIRLATGGSYGKKIELTRMSLDQRLARLREADQLLATVQDDSEQLLRDAWRQDVVGAVRLDAPRVAEFLRTAELRREDVQEARQKLSEVIQAWPDVASESAVYAGELPRLVDVVQYKLYLGDAWTDPARIEMIPLPIVQLRMDVKPPEYARSAAGEAAPAARQLAVLEGSKVDFGIEVTNSKRLVKAWVVVASMPEPKRFELKPHPSIERRWRLDDPASPFQSVMEELRFEVQVRDDDGMMLERPLQGQLRLRSDRPPSGSQEVVHRVVLPKAKPVIEYRANDDFGVAGVRLLVQVEKQSASSDKGRLVESAENEAAATEKPPRVFELVRADQIALPERLPLTGKYPLDLATFDLVKGDRVRLVLEVQDYRGTQVGQTYQSDPLYLEISDESGVYAAILEADQKSEKQLNEIIRRELGIGESP